MGRRFSDALYLAPGVSSGGQVGQANPSIAGGSGLENSYVVDGVNITNGGYGALGSYSIVFGSLGNGLPFDFIKEAQVQDRRLPGRVRPGHRRRRQRHHEERDEQLRAASSATTGRTAWRARYKQVQTTERHGQHRRHARKTTSAPKWAGRSSRARLFFFGAIDPQSNATLYLGAGRLPATEPRRRCPGSAHHAVRGEGDVADDTDAAHRRVVLRRPGARRQRAAALHGALEPGHVSVQPAGQVRRPQPVRKYEGSIHGKWLVEGSFARAANNLVEVPSVDQWSVTDDTVAPHQPSGGIGFYEVGNESTNWQYQAPRPRT